MKSFFKTILLAACSCMLMFQLASCLSDSDNSSNSTVLTPQEAAHYLQTVQGTYVGKIKLYHYVKNIYGGDSVAADSVTNYTMHINASDSMAYLTVPARLLAYTTKSNEKLSKAIAKATDPSLKFKLLPYRGFDDDSRYMSFQFIPYEPLSMDVSYDEGETHNVSLKFSLNTTFANSNVNVMGIYSTSDRMIEFMFIPYEYQMDGKNNYYAAKSVFDFYGKKQ